MPRDVRPGVGPLAGATLAAALPAGAGSCVGVAAGADAYRTPGSWIESAQGRYGDGRSAFDRLAIDSEGTAEGLPAYQRTWAATLDYRLFTWRDAALEAGASYVHELTRFSGRHANFSISVSDPVREAAQLWFKHLSHGSMVGIEPHKRNNGCNFAGARVPGYGD